MQEQNQTLLMEREWVITPTDEGIDVHLFLIRYAGKMVNKVELSSRKETYFVGRDSALCQIVLTQSIVSRKHLQIAIDGSTCSVQDLGSKNHTYINKEILGNEVPYTLAHGDILYIDNQSLTHTEGVTIAYYQKLHNTKIEGESLPLHQEVPFTFGRDSQCSLSSNHPMVSRNHFKVMFAAENWVLEDQLSTNGTYLNGQRVNHPVKLENKDRIYALDAKFVFIKSNHGYELIYSTMQQGISVESMDLVKKGINRETKADETYLDHVSIAIEAGEFVSIVGGSGAGKSTLMDCLNRFRPADSGLVFINQEDFEKNYESYKGIIGYVQQKDVLYESLSVVELLTYCARLRMPDDTSEKEINDRIKEVIADVSLTDQSDKFIRKLSGGQKKRVSIAIELISKPKILFLDEPTSGLDPGMDKNMMELLRKLSRNGATIILVTHATSNVYLCDKVIFMGKGGKLCYIGSPLELLSHFEENDIVDIYTKLTLGPSAEEQVKKSHQKMMSSESYIQMLDKIKKNTSKDVVPTKREDKKGSGIKQFLVLFKRYFKIIFMDKVSRNIMLLQAPLMFFILMLVKKDDCFKTFTGGKEILFTISCMTALMGILNAFLEICKEREILKREHRTGLRLIPYLMSKVTVLGIIGTLQAGFLVGGSFLFLDLPTHDLLGSTVLEYLMTLCLSIQASTAIGLLISSTAQTTERATLVMPAAIVLQLVFAGVLFKFTSVTRFISYFIVSKWTMSALGTLFNLNALPFSTSLAVNPPTVVDKMYLYEVDHLIQTWLALLLIMLVSYIMSYLLLSRNVKNNER